MKRVHCTAKGLSAHQILSMLLVIVIATVSISACSVGQTKAQKAQHEAEKDLQGIQKSNPLVLKKLIDQLGINYEGKVDMSTISDNKEIIAYFMEANSKMTYEIVSVDEESLTVKVRCKYIDSRELVDSLSQKIIAYTIATAFSGNKLTEDEIKDMLLDEMAQPRDEVFKTKEFDMNYFDDGDDISLIEVPEGLIDVATAGVYDPLMELKKSFEGLLK